MALMVCPDCGGNVSDTAELCINCGCDLYLYKEELRIDEEIERKVIAYEKTIKKPVQITSLSEVHRYRNEDAANSFMLIMSLILLVFGCFALVCGIDAFLCVLIIIVGLIFLAVYGSMRNNSKKLLKEEQDKIQRVIDNFEEIKRNRVILYRQTLLSQKQTELEKIKNRNVQRTPERPKGLRCPACDSTMFEKISTLNRVVSVELVGIASSKIGKQYKCKNCGHMW